MTKVYAVRQKSTGLFIPILERGRRRGGSWLEPTADRPPRIFPSKLSATSFLGNWLRGIFKNNYYQTEEGPEPYLSVEKQEHRKKEDMEIVEFELIEVVK